MSELKYLTTKEVAELLKVTPTTVRAYINRKEGKRLKAVKRGKHYYITEHDLKDFMSDN